MTRRRGAAGPAPTVPRRRIQPAVALNLAVSIIVGGLVLFGFLAPDQAGAMVRLFSNWTTTIIVFALLLGFGNVLRVHLGRILARRAGWPYSVALVGGALLVPLLGFSGTGIGDRNVQWIFDWIYQPIGSSLFALLTFFVAAAAFRALRAGPSAAWAVLAVALLVIVGTAPWSQEGPLSTIAGIKDWVVAYPALAGLRGIVIGSALGAIATSLRVLLGIDRPYVN
ncbi:MAG: hypothetical protein M3Z04_14495 [Chloroflexota bacterium]|nr:hypothetical protein [Chloroflexota bacterium]